MTTDSEGAADETPPPPPAVDTVPNRNTNTYDRYRSPDVGWGTAIMQMVPDPNACDYRTVPWVVFLKVRCENVARLMDEGFHWTVDDNILREEGSMSHRLRGEWEAFGFRHARRWTLADKGRETPRWVALLEVVTPFLEILPAFPLHELSTANIISANACDARDKLVYNYSRATPGQNYNCLYDLRPLRGWWPWPKEETPKEAPMTLAALTAAYLRRGKDGGSEGDEPLPDPPDEVPPQLQLSGAKLEAHRRRLNQFRKSLLAYEASLVDTDPESDETVEDSCA